MRNYSRAIPKVLRERGMNDSIPDGLLREESSIPTHLQMLTVIDPSIISIKEKAKLLRDGLNHHERLVYLANHDPIVPLCQEG